MWSGRLVFFTIGASWRGSVSQWLFCEFPIWSQQTFFLSGKINIFCGRVGLSLFKSFAAQSCTSWPVIRIDVSYLMRNTGCLQALVIEIVLNHGLDRIYKFGSSFLFRTIWVRLPSCRTFIITIGLILSFIIRKTVLDWHSNTLKSSYWNIRCECLTVQSAVSKFMREGLMSWSCLPHRQWPTASSFLPSKQIQKNRRMNEITYSKWQQFIHHRQTYTI